MKSRSPRRSRVKRAWAAIDAGLAINPDGLINQTEGGIIQSASWTLKEQIRYDRERIVTRGWDDYPILTFAEAPRSRGDGHRTAPASRRSAPGKAAQGPTAAAIANAVYNALGVRLRDMPFTRERVSCRSRVNQFARAD